MHDTRNLFASMQGRSKGFEVERQERPLSRVVYRNLIKAKTYDLLSRVLFKAERA
jgi:hypothetical protein